MTNKKRGPGRVSVRDRTFSAVGRNESANAIAALAEPATDTPPPTRLRPAMTAIIHGGPLPRVPFPKGLPQPGDTVTLNYPGCLELHPGQLLDTPQLVIAERSDGAERTVMPTPMTTVDGLPLVVRDAFYDAPRHRTRVELTVGHRGYGGPRILGAFQ